MKKMLLTFISPYTRIYKNKDLYKEKKATYTILFLFFIVSYSLVTFIVTIGFNNDKIRSMSEFLVWIILVPLILWLIKTGRLVSAINLFLVLGIGKGITLFDTPMGIQLFTQMSLVSLTLAAVAVKKYQLYAGSAAAYFLIIFKSFYHLNTDIYSSADIIINYRLAAFVTFFIYLLTIHYLNSIVDREISKASNMNHMMNTDVLTQLPNRYAFNAYVSTMEQKKSYYLMILDLDYFKKINDTYGHLLGDKVLIQIAGLIRSNLRHEDRVFRIGGEEFCIILEDVTEENGGQIAKQLCSLISCTALSIAEPVTASIGASFISTDWQVRQFDQYFSKADKALYKAKENGRNQVMV